jgi:ribosomal 50S subunit-recycling heat shock protein
VEEMRLDSFLARSRLVPRRTRANQVCRLGLILRNDRPAKPSDRVRVGDRLTVMYNDRTLVVEGVLIPRGNLRRSEAADTYRLTAELPAYDGISDTQNRLVDQIDG